MAIPSTPATPKQMQDEALKELDRMRIMSIQSLAMQRIRDSVVTLSRETGFRERPVEAFTQAPLYIPQYQQWSNTQQRIVGTAPPTAPTMSGRQWDRARTVGMQAIDILTGKAQPQPGGLEFFRIPGRGNRYSSRYRPEISVSSVQAQLRKLNFGRESSDWLAYISNYQSWQQAQRNLPT